jgi:hypothetical protein
MILQLLLCEPLVYLQDDTGHRVGFTWLTS